MDKQDPTTRQKVLIYAEIQMKLLEREKALSASIKQQREAFKTILCTSYKVKIQLLLLFYFFIFLLLLFLHLKSQA